jgi:hypothetical protein
VHLFFSGSADPAWNFVVNTYQCAARDLSPGLRSAARSDRISPAIVRVQE